MEKMNSLTIAKLAGVSRSTVSRVINGYSNVPDETRERVMKVIKENHYYPIFSGQLLAGKKSETIGFFWITDVDIADDFLISSYMVHVIEAAAHLGYLVLTCIVPNLTDKKNTNWIRKIFMEQRIDAGVFINVDNYEPLIEELIAAGKIVGIFDHFQYGKNERERISVNFESDTGEKVIDYVVSKGHRKIAIIDGSFKRFSSLRRHEGYIRGMQKHNIPIHQEWINYTGIEASGGYDATMRILAASKNGLPTVICANNDNTAFGVYRALEDSGISIPGQISVIGVDGHPKGAIVSPPLTTVQFNFKEMFRSLVARTIAAIDENNQVQQVEEIPGQLLERESCRTILPEEQ